jgi:ABC-type lipoprotein release transport system permease subunit
MRKINLRILRGLSTIKLRVVAILATIALGVAVSGGIFSAMESIFYTQDTLFQQTHFADLEVSFVPEDVKNLPDLSKIDGVAKVERRLVFPGVTQLKDGKRLPTLLVFLDRPAPEVNALQISAGSPLDAKDQDGVVIERGLANFHAYGPGDAIRIDVGERHYDFKVKGVAFSPEYLTSSSNPDYFIPEKGALGVVFANVSKVSDALGFEMVNDFVFTFAPGANTAAVKSQIVSKLAGFNVERIVPRENHFSYKFVRMDLSSMRRFVPALVLVLVALAFLLTLLTFNRLVSAERKEIGVLLAIGYRRGDILRSYLFAGVLLGILGSLLGLALSFLIRAVYAKVYSEAMGLPTILLQVYPSILGVSALVGLLSATVSSVVPCFRLLYLGERSGVVQEVIRQTQRASAGASKLTRALFSFFSLGPIGFRYGTRNLARRGGLTLSMILSMGLALSVPIAYGIAVSSIRGTVVQNFQREHWDLAIDFLYPVFPEDVLDLAKIDPGVKTEPYFRSSAELWKGDQFQISGLLGIQPQTEMKTVRLIRGRNLSTGSSDEIIISKDLAEKLHVDLGDSLDVKVREVKYPFKIVGVESEIMIAQCIMSLDAARHVLGFSDKITGLYVRGASHAPALTQQLYSQEYVGRVTSKKQMADSFISLLAEITKLVVLAAVISILVALLFIFTSINITISEQEREYATLKALGFGKRILRTIILTEAWAQAAVAAVIAIPIGFIVARALTARMSQAWFIVDLFWTPPDILGILLPALALIPVFASPGIRSLLRMPISQALSTKLQE